jgi:hypothetical protein
VRALDSSASCKISLCVVTVLLPSSIFRSCPTEQTSACLHTTHSSHEYQVAHRHNNSLQMLLHQLVSRVSPQSLSSVTRACNRAHMLWRQVAAIINVSSTWVRVRHWFSEDWYRTVAGLGDDRKESCYRSRRIYRTFISWSCLLKALCNLKDDWKSYPRNRPWRPIGFWDVKDPVKDVKEACYEDIKDPTLTR